MQRNAKGNPQLLAGVSKEEEEVKKVPVPLTALLPRNRWQAGVYRIVALGRQLKVQDNAVLGTPESK